MRAVSSRRESENKILTTKGEIPARGQRNNDKSCFKLREVDARVDLHLLRAPICGRPRSHVLATLLALSSDATVAHNDENLTDIGFSHQIYERNTFPPSLIYERNLFSREKCHDARPRVPDPVRRDFCVS